MKNKHNIISNNKITTTTTILKIDKIHFLNKEQALITWLENNLL